jgi:glycine cleavage system H protein
MTVLLFIATLIVFLTIDYLLHRREYALKTADLPQHEYQPVTMNAFPTGLHLAKNHVWMQTEKDGVVTCGIDGFLARTLGALSGVHVPQKGFEVGPDKRNIALLQEGKLLTLQAPFDGTVVALNSEALESTDLVTKDPYGKGWLMKIRGSLDAVETVSVSRPAEWLKEQMDAAVAFLLTRTPEHQLATLQDGGLMVEGPLREFDAEVWREFNDRFVTLKEDSVAQPQREG